MRDDSMEAGFKIQNPDEILDRARSLAPRLRERLFETVELRKLPQSTIDEAEAAGIIGLLVPKALGGAGAGLHEYVELLRILAHGDMSAAWVLGFFAVHTWYGAQFSEMGQAVMFAGGRMPKMAAAAKPPGRAEPVEGGYRLSGTWTYGSGIMNADYCMVSGLIPGKFDKDPLKAALMCVVPRDAFEILDTWHMSGMQGTGSQNAKLENMFIPEHMTVMFDQFSYRPRPEARFHEEEIFSYAQGDVFPFIFPAIILGGAEAIVEEYRKKLGTKRDFFSQGLVSDTPAAQIRYARAISALRAASAVLDNAVQLSIRSNAETAEDKSAEIRANIKLDCLTVCRLAFEAAELAARISGTSAFRSDNIIPRFLQDIHTAISHVTIDEDIMQQKAGEILLDRATGPEPAKWFV